MLLSCSLRNGSIVGGSAGKNLAPSNSPPFVNTLMLVLLTLNIYVSGTNSGELDVSLSFQVCNSIISNDGSTFISPIPKEAHAFIP